MLVEAHTGHWALQLVYLAPLGVLVVVIARAKLQERRETASETEAPPV